MFLSYLVPLFSSLLFSSIYIQFTLISPPLSLVSGPYVVRRLHLSGIWQGLLSRMDIEKLPKFTPSYSAQNIATISGSLTFWWVSPIMSLMANFETYWFGCYQKKSGWSCKRQCTHGHGNFHPPSLSIINFYRLQQKLWSIVLLYIEMKSNKTYTYLFLKL